MRLAARRACWLRSSGAAPAPAARQLSSGAPRCSAHTFGGGWRAARAPTLAAGARRSPGALCRRQLSTGEQAPTATDQLKKAKQRNKLLFGGIAAGLVGTGLYHYEEILQWKDDFWETYTNPAMALLLPPLQPEQKGMKTLVVSFCMRACGGRAEPAAWSQLDLEDTMVDLAYNRTHGWRVHKRPYLDDFLDYLALSGLYELVVFSNGYQFSIEPVLDKIDPMVLTSRGLQIRFQHRLSRSAAAAPSVSAAAGMELESRCARREHAKLKGTHWTKPVDALNREPEKVVVVDKEGDEKWQPHPNNCIAIPKWDSDDENDNDTAVRLPASLLCTNDMSDEPFVGSCWT